MLKNGCHAQNSHSFCCVNHCADEEELEVQTLAQSTHHCTKGKTCGNCWPHLGTDVEIQPALGNVWRTRWDSAPVRMTQITVNVITTQITSCILACHVKDNYIITSVKARDKDIITPAKTTQVTTISMDISNWLWGKTAVKNGKEKKKKASSVLSGILSNKTHTSTFRPAVSGSLHAQTPTFRRSQFQYIQTEWQEVFPLSITYSFQHA